MYQGESAVFLVFFQELFPTKTPGDRVRHFTEHRHPDHFVPALDLRVAVDPTPEYLCRYKTCQLAVVLPSGAAFRAAADANQSEVVQVVGSTTFGLAILAAFTARETFGEMFRVHLDDLGERVPPHRSVPQEQVAVRPDPFHRRGHPDRLRF